MNDNQPAIDAALAQINQGVSAYAAACYPDHEGTYVQGWVLTGEWTSVALEQGNQGGVISATPVGQAISMSRGLSEFGAERYSLFDNGDDEEDDE